MSSLASIADALATRFVGLTADGEVLASTPTRRLPNVIGQGPVILVYPPSGTVQLGTSARRDDHHTFEVKLLRDPTDVPGRSDKLYAWFDAMRDLIGQQMQLGLVDLTAELTDYRLELDGQKYGGGVFGVVELTIEVRVNEHVLTVSA